MDFDFTSIYTDDQIMGLVANRIPELIAAREFSKFQLFTHPSERNWDSPNARIIEAVNEIEAELFKGLKILNTRPTDAA